ncbi:uncharacterized protein EI97DRAFT_446650 [Westerdykella ornata]|uniref:RBR-type E3 ubiquitin transferase n=1 Tax=Westerdykella ornata TaxID=318751 RepID=A0A6A6J4R2_WESOR|nr:uncharacterized protein EI97DRAFT_446650 [Westerdykella ornata]KAF2271382.1 hypothetical protein EI97DRAFT_446650 [Westerdykella ornata]
MAAHRRILTRSAAKIRQMLSTLFKKRTCNTPVPKTCYVCLEESSRVDLVRTCPSHFICRDCVPAALQNQIPLSCHSAYRIPPERFRGEVDKTLIKKYEEKLEGNDIPVRLRVYCASPRCSKLLARHTHRHTQQVHFAKCDCGKKTCLTCKSLLGKVNGHICVSDTDANGRPIWLPQYTSTFRAKPCPNCRIVIEHMEWCNRIICPHCDHSWCFVCLRPEARTTGDYGLHDCPLQGDPECDYDEEGYEKSPRGIHRDTGLPRPTNTVMADSHDPPEVGVIDGGDRP